MRAACCKSIRWKLTPDWSPLNHCDEVLVRYEGEEAVSPSVVAGASVPKVLGSIGHIESQIQLKSNPDMLIDDCRVQHFRGEHDTFVTDAAISRSLATKSACHRELLKMQTVEQPESLPGVHW